MYLQVQIEVLVQVQGVRQCFLGRANILHGSSVFTGTNTGTGKDTGTGSKPVTPGQG